MIAVTRLDGGAMVINVDLIETIELTPDTLISMSNGDKLYVRESLDEIVDLVVRFKRAILEGTGTISPQRIRTGFERPRSEDAPWQ
jgi:flagellar protein FlbD